MSFTAREYFPLKLLYARWDLAWEDVTYAIENGLLRACVYLPMRWMEYGHRENDKFIVDKTAHCEGLVAVQPKDTRRIFCRGENSLMIFESIHREHYLLRLASEPAQGPLTFSLEEIVVLTKDSIAFEEKHQIEMRQHNGKIRLLRSSGSTPTTRNDASFSNNYQNIQVGGQHFQLGMIQAQVVRRLHEALLAGSPWVHGKILLNDAGSTCTRLRDMFRAQPVWKALIESDGRGYYRLNLAASSDDPPLRRAG
jgi:hypothetical protein